MKVHNIEQRSEEWLQLKKGKIGGTRLKAVTAKNNLPLIYELIAEEGVDEIEPSYTNEAMRWGIDMEPIALHEYEKISGFQVINSGWWESDFSELVGLSPDGSNENYTRAVEVKCPNTKTHVEYIIGDRIPAAYKMQVLMYFIVNTELQSLDFVSFDPRYTKKPVWVKRIHRDEVEEDAIFYTGVLKNFLAKLVQYRGKLNNS